MRPKEKAVLILGIVLIMGALSLLSVAIPREPHGFSTALKAGVVNHTHGFQSPNDLEASGSAVFSDGLALLTTGKDLQAGSIFSRDLVKITNFRNTFTFRILAGNIHNMAGGFCFVIQNDSPSALGEPSYGLGWFGIADVCIKFDVYDNEGEGTSSTGIFTRWSAPTVGNENDGTTILVDLSEAGIDLRNQQVFMVDMTYEDSVLDMSITDLYTSTAYIDSFQIDIPGEVGSSSAFVGFTGSTEQGATSTVEILTWVFDGDFRREADVLDTNETS